MCKNCAIMITLKVPKHKTNILSNSYTLIPLAAVEYTTDNYRYIDANAYSF